jgi:hypothetical protein
LPTSRGDKIALLRGIAPDGDHSRSEHLAQYVLAELTQESADLLKAIYDFISRGLLQSAATYGARAIRLARLGFDLRTVALKPKLRLDHLVNLLLAIMALLLVSMTFLVPSGGGSFGMHLYQALMVAVIYIAAVVCAVYPKESWRFAKRRRGNVRPAAFYLTAAILAVAASLVIRLAFQLAIFHPLSEVLLRFRLSIPWSLSTFVTAFMVAWMTDDVPNSNLTRGRLRWIEALAGGAALALSAVFVVGWLGQRGAPAAATGFLGGQAPRDAPQLALHGRLLGGVRHGLNGDLDGERETGGEESQRDQGVVRQELADRHELPSLTSAR